MQMSDAVEVVEELNIDRVNQRLADGWTLLAVVPGYDHRQAQAQAQAAKDKSPFMAG